MKAITVKEYSELYGISVRTLNDQIQKGKLPEGVIKTISAGSGRTCAKLLVMSEEKKIPKKVGVFLG